jgi:hypothetical protein
LSIRAVSLASCSVPIPETTLRTRHADVNRSSPAMPSLSVIPILAPDRGDLDEILDRGTRLLLAMAKSVFLKSPTFSAVFPRPAGGR